MKSLVLTLALFFFTAVGWADVQWQDYSPEAVATAQKQGKKVVLGFHKKGCSTCHKQDRALKETGLTEDKSVVFLKVEKKKRKHAEVYKKYGFSPRQWAALVLLDKGQEKARVEPGVTSSAAIERFSQMAR